MNLILKLALLLSLPLSFPVMAQQTAAEVEAKYAYLPGNLGGKLYAFLNDDADSLRRLKIKSVKEKSVDGSEQHESVDYYNSNGLITEHTGEGGTYRFKSLYSYSNTNELLKAAQYINEKLVSVDSLFYNAKGKCVSIHSYNLTDTSFSNWEISYDSEGRLSTMAGISNTWKTRNYFCAYDENGKVRSILEIKCSSSKCDTMWNITVKRDQSNRIIAFDEWNKNSGWISIKRDSLSVPEYWQRHCIYAYKSNGFVVHKSEHYGRTQQETWYTYNAENRLHTQSFFTNSTDNVNEIYYSKDTVKETYFYFPRKDSIVHIRPDHDRPPGHPISIMADAVVITYNDKGQKTQIIRSSGQERFPPFLVFRKQYWKYDGRGRLIEESEMIPDYSSERPDQYIRSYALRYKYDKNDLVTERYKIGKTKDASWHYYYSYTFYK